MRNPRRSAISIGVIGVLLGLAACGGPPVATPGPATPQGRVVTVNQGANTLSVIDVSTDTILATVPTGAAPHHVVPNGDARELWVTLYEANYLQIFDAGTLQAIGQVDLGGPSDDLTFAPDGRRLYVSMGKSDVIAVVDPQARQVVSKVPVGRTPHGVKVRPDGRELYVTNTADNTVSILSLDGEPAVAASLRVGANPFEVTFDPAGAQAFVSYFLGDSVGIIATATRKITGTVRVGKQPAMLAIIPGSAGDQLWVANTGTQEVWVLDPATRKLVTRIPAGGGSHGVMPTPAGKVYITNTNDNTVTVIDAAGHTVRATLAVGTTPNGLTFVPNPAAKEQ